MGELYYYWAYGLIIASEMCLPELAVGCGKPDIFIYYGSVPTGLPEAKASGLCYQATKEKFLIKVEGIARYLVEEGAHIIIDPEDQVQENDLRVFLLGVVLGALLQQRGLFVMKAAAVVKDNQAKLFLGGAGTGKSMLAALCCQHGYSLLADGLCAIHFGADTGSYNVLPAYPYIRLWIDSLKFLHVRTQGLLQGRRDIERYGVDFSKQFCQTPMPIHSIYILEVPSAGSIQVKKIDHEVEKMNAIRSRIYRYEYLVNSSHKEQCFNQCISMAKRISVYRLNWPQKMFDKSCLIHSITEGEML